MLLDHGHPEARHYPIGMLWDEVGFVVERENTRQITAAVLIQLAISANFDKKGGKQFKDMTDDLAVIVKQREEKPDGP